MEPIKWSEDDMICFHDNEAWTNIKTPKWKPDCGYEVSPLYLGTQDEILNFLVDGIINENKHPLIKRTLLEIKEIREENGYFGTVSMERTVSNGTPRRNKATNGRVKKQKRLSFRTPRSKNKSISL